MRGRRAAALAAWLGCVCSVWTAPSSSAPTPAKKPSRPAAARPSSRPAPRPTSPPRPPAPPLPFLPSIPRVRVDLSRTHAVVVQEINLPRGGWRSGDLDLYVAFGAPGAPLAFDAHLLPVADGALEPASDDVGEALTHERASRKPASANLLLGRPQMAGRIVRVREATFRSALAKGNMAALRLRTVLPLPAVDAQGARELVVRLGVEGGAPLTLGRLQLAALESTPFVRAAEAHLCGKEAVADPLAVAFSASPGAPFARAPKPPAPAATTPAAPSAPIAPVLAVRHGSDDLCLRFWTAAPKG